MERHELWLAKAKSDLQSAKYIFEGNREDVFDTMISHTQQSAEKALKAFLVFCDVPIFRTHDLDKLLWLCEEMDSQFSLLADHTKKLNPLATEYRYPADDFDDLSIPTRDELEMAILSAQEILDFVGKKIGDEKDQKNH